MRRMRWQACHVLLSIRYRQSDHPRGSRSLRKGRQIRRTVGRGVTRGRRLDTPTPGCQARASSRAKRRYCPPTWCRGHRAAAPETGHSQTRLSTPPRSPPATAPRPPLPLAEVPLEPCPFAPPSEPATLGARRRVRAGRGGQRGAGPRKRHGKRGNSMHATYTAIRTLRRRIYVT